MTNIEIKDMDGVYYKRTVPEFFDEYVKGQQFINLDLVSSIKFHEIKNDFSINRVTDEIEIDDRISWQNSENVEVKKGWKLIELNYPEFVVVKILISKEQINEYHRIHRILTEKLCVK